jgi:hypothetical protein
VSPETEKARRKLVDEIVESEPRLKRARESQREHLQYLLRKRADLDAALASLAPAAVEGEPVGFISQAAVKMLKAGNAVCIAGKADEYFFVPVYTATQVAALTAQCEGLTRWKRGDKVKWKSADGNTNRGYIVSANSVRINIGNGYIHSVDPVEWGLEHDTEAANRGVV